jgi:hypothetical protein
MTCFGVHIYTIEYNNKGQCCTEKISDLILDTINLPPLVYTQLKVV